MPGVIETEARGFGIKPMAHRLRNLAWVERRSIKLLAGWFLRVRNLKAKYRLAYALYDAVEHVSWLRLRLSEMRGGNPDAGVRPELKAWVDSLLEAPEESDFLAAYFGVFQAELRAVCREDLDRSDASANANERRLLQRILLDVQGNCAWWEQFSKTESEPSRWGEGVCEHLRTMGGLHGEDRAAGVVPPLVPGIPFHRPATIDFGPEITKGELVRYEARGKLPPQEATIEQFKVFFNEFYAAALLASVLFDAAENEYPWEFFADFGRHFWDEARHSEFGAIRLRELGVEPDRVNPVLFEEAQGMPVLHRVVYLTRGLEAYFMPRKPKRFKEYEAQGDHRSQLFADQDWSDEINHVRYGSRWSDFLLQDDVREIDDVIEEIKAYLAEVRREPVVSIGAPF